MAYSAAPDSGAWTLLIATTVVTVCCSELQNMEPEFLNPMQNVTVALGREATLVCSVKNIGEHKVGWLKAEDQTILSLHERVVTENRRIDIDVDNNTYWKLKIRQLQRSDKGCYMCQINTQEMKNQIGCVDVKVPPDIKDDETISDITVMEGANATLVCKAKGNPVPKITWKREEEKRIILKKKLKEISYEKVHGEPLFLVNVRRSQMGHYLCIASNDVPPAVSKRITLNIQFAPEITVPNQVVNASRDTTGRLECTVESFPFAQTYWEDSKGNSITTSENTYKLEEIKTSHYKVTMYLEILKLEYSDFQKNYTCLAKNSLGTANGFLRLHEIIKPTTTTTTTSTTTTTTTTPKPTTVSTTTRMITRPPVIPSSPTNRKNSKVHEGDRKYGGKSVDTTGRRMNGVEKFDEIETQSSSHRASRGSSRARRSTVSQSVGIAAELVLLAAVTAGWSTGCAVDAVVGLVSLALAACPPLFLLAWRDGDVPQ
ncbi:Immunoglobulin subtype,Immunoglobulin-like domain,Immunoglobulin-like fold,Immunoglobulin subtype [Cinara cedri]|uniref:Immunoglobulin subtype,Immunoglobulin-like domain,Immunoglobulin-like fold,Immunoglobulin subtype n=1 Tax=Cinara cedri TaxID=506608 RepID=A0A5E4LYQ9_9HEMI|nr:Immunoglobulin subtype,Immunoglobulin-like domain,Immunoglobulin-like fold,Immunoglobulin subtype [Cinara cedri]